MYVLYDETAGKKSEFSTDVVSLRNIIFHYNISFCIFNVYNLYIERVRVMM